MAHYRLYILDDKGHIARSLDLDCRDDDEARATAAEHRKQYDIEIWQADRFVGAYARDQKPR